MSKLNLKKDNTDTNLKEDNSTGSLVSEFWLKVKKQKLTLIAGMFIILIFLVAVFGAYIAPYDAYTPNYDEILAKPSFDHLAGTDEYGRDIFSRIIIGTRITLLLSIISVTAGAIVGIFLGIISGYYEGWLDRIIMRGNDVLFAFPDILLAIGVIAILGPGLKNIVIAIAVYSVPSFARIVRSSTLTTKSATYVEAATSLGGRNRRIIWRHIFPDTTSSIIVYYTMKIGTAILAIASLSFLGLGGDPSSPNWGAMLSTGRNYLEIAPHVMYFPGIAIFVTALIFNLLGDGLRDVLDPKIKD